jgi:hypothetical protein
MVSQGLDKLTSSRVIRVWQALCGGWTETTLDLKMEEDTTTKEKAIPQRTIEKKIIDQPHEVSWSSPTSSPTIDIGYVITDRDQLIEASRCRYSATIIWSKISHWPMGWNVSMTFLVFSTPNATLSVFTRNLYGMLSAGLDGSKSSNSDLSGWKVANAS